MGDICAAICGGLCASFCDSLCIPVGNQRRYFCCSDDSCRCKCCDRCLNCGWDDGELAEDNAAHPRDEYYGNPPAYSPPPEMKLGGNDPP